MKYIIVTGNIIDGVEFIGPFDTPEEIHEYANTGNLPDYVDWNIGYLYSPEENSVLTEEETTSTLVLEARDEK